MVAAALAKLAGIRKAVEETLDDEFGRRGGRPLQNYPASEVGHYFEGAQRALEALRVELPGLYEDFQQVAVVPDVSMAITPGADQLFRYSRAQLQRLSRDINQVFEIRSNSELSAPVKTQVPKSRVFISHGRANDWREVQSYIEKDIGLPTLELAQEANQGRTILEKLLEGAEQCDSAVIIMTGDDLDGAGQARARENVIHEIGFFQGKYGLSRICLLHEEGVNIPSNIHGLVYTPFLKGSVNATFGLLVRELKAMYK